MKVKDLLTDESKWCQGAFARGVNGRLLNSDVIMNYDSPEACSRCLLGAVSTIYGLGNRQEPISKLRQAIKELHGMTMDIVTWNDVPGRTFEQVRAVVELADV